MFVFISKSPVISSIQRESEYELVSFPAFYLSIFRVLAFIGRSELPFFPAYFLRFGIYRQVEAAFFTCLLSAFWHLQVGQGCLFYLPTFCILPFIGRLGLPFLPAYFLRFGVYRQVETAFFTCLHSAFRHLQAGWGCLFYLPTFCILPFIGRLRLPFLPAYILLFAIYRQI